MTTRAVCALQVSIREEIVHRWKRVLLAVVAVPTIVVTMGAAQGEIRSSHHDFSGSAWSGFEICAPCHTPHGADQAVPNAPLWNHQVTTASYSVYTSTTLDASVGQAGGASKLCLSCHDGTVAIDSFGGSTGSRFMRSSLATGTDLSGHHPISFVYDAALATADGELWDPSGTSSGLGGTIASDLLVGGRLECSSCHDVHLARNTSGCGGCHNMHAGTTTLLSLRKDNSNSAFCLTCHKK